MREPIAQRVALPRRKPRTVPPGASWNDPVSPTGQVCSPSADNASTVARRIANDIESEFRIWKEKLLQAVAGFNTTKVQRPKEKQVRKKSMTNTPYGERTQRATSQVWQSQELAELPTRKPSSFPVLIFFIILGAGIAFAYALHGLTVQPGSLWIVAIAAAVALFAASAIKVADQWDRAVILRLGKFRALRGPGQFGIIPIIDTVPYWVDTRVIPTSFKAEKTLTKDTVPVDVDAVLFWQSR